MDPFGLIGHKNQTSAQFLLLHSFFESILSWYTRICEVLSMNFAE